MALFGDKSGEQAYRVLCQNERCRATLGTMHIPCTGGRVVFVCYVCASISAFTNGACGIKAELAGVVPPEQMRKTTRGVSPKVVPAGST